MSKWNCCPSCFCKFFSFSRAFVGGGMTPTISTTWPIWDAIIWRNTVQQRTWWEQKSHKLHRGYLLVHSDLMSHSIVSELQQPKTTRPVISQPTRKHYEWRILGQVPWSDSVLVWIFMVIAARLWEAEGAIRGFLLPHISIQFGWIWFNFCPFRGCVSPEKQ